MSVYNGEPFLAQAIDSILDQTFTDFELIVINDGSTDGTDQVLARYDDPRLRVYTQSNQGIPRSRNRALSLSRGEYIAVMDADDVSLPNRLERQVDFLNAHPDIGLLGTACRVIDELSRREWDYRPPLADEELRRHLIRGNPFVHTSTIMHKSVLDAIGGYNEAYPYILDYELFVRLAKVTRLANLPKVLVLHYYHIGSVSTTMRTELLRLWLRMRVRYQAFRSLGYPPHYSLYILQPILFTIAELRPKLLGYLRQFMNVDLKDRLDGNASQKN